MKKIVRKFVIICICLFCVICQVSSNNVYAYSIEEIKENVDFKTVEEDGEPEEYDILIDAKDLITDEKLPAGIKTTIEDVLYDNTGLFNIDFFGKEEAEDNNKNSSKEKNNNKKNKSSSENNDETEDKNEEKAKAIRSFVRNAYKVLLYIASAAMIIVLIYMAIVTVTSGISPTLNILPFSNIINGKKGEKPNQKLKSKKLVEQWVTSVISLALAVFVMNLIVAFSNNIVNDIENKKVENETITVYVKNSQFATNAPILGSSGSTSSASSSSTITASSGDTASLRQKVVDQAKSLDNLGASGGYCEMWVELVYRTALGRPNIPYQNCAHEAGQKAVNSSTSTDNIVPGAAVFSFRSSSGTIDSACGQDAGHVGIYIGDGQIASCTGRGSTGVVIHTIDEWKQSWEFSCWGWLPGTEDLADGAVGDSTGSSSGIQTKTVDYYFKTNLEGLLMFQSQYNSKGFPLKSGINMASGMVVTFFKSVLYCVFVTRMILLALISIIMPILILIDAFIKIGGGKSFLMNWIKIYLYLVLLRPVIAFIYYVLVQSNVYLISEFPFYIVFVIIGISILFVKSIKYLINDLNGKKKKNAVSKS